MHFERKKSTQSSVEYAVIGTMQASMITAYTDNKNVIEAMRLSYKSHGDPTSFERNVLSRCGGAVVKVYGAQFGQSHWPPTLYREFVNWLHDNYKEKRKRWDATCKRRGWDSDMFEPMPPVPKAMYFNGIRKCYQTEPWFTEEDLKPHFDPKASDEGDSSELIVS
jgi:hypothetical protein